MGSSSTRKEHIAGYRSRIFYLFCRSQYLPLLLEFNTIVLFFEESEINGRSDSCLTKEKNEVNGFHAQRRKRYLSIDKAMKRPSGEISD